MDSIISISDLNKTYKNGVAALNNIDLDIESGEIFALLGPNGAGKTTLINIICGIATATSGSIRVGGFDIIKDYRKSRALIAVVPQELTTDIFESVWNTVTFSRGLFGLAPNPGYIEKLLKDLSLWDKRDHRIMTLSGGMKRRLMIAKALSHEPRVLFLDEPTAGVDVVLRKDMWAQVRALRETGVTIFLTTHYINEAEEMADRIGVINKGDIIVVEDKKKLMKKFGTKRMYFELQSSLSSIPETLSSYDLHLENGHLVYTYDSRQEKTGIVEFFDKLKIENIHYRDIYTKESSLEEIFVELVKK